MRVFLTGSTGFIGSAIVPELLAAGHQVLGLVRSESSADALIRAGAEPHRGDITDLESLRAGAAQCDAVIHTAFDHDFNHFVENCEKDRRAVEALGSGLRPGARFIVTSGTALGNPADGGLATEDVYDVSRFMPRRASEEAAAAVAARGGEVMVLRLPQVHDTVKQGLVTYLVAVAQQKGVSAYAGDGSNRWCAGHVLDVARLYRLVLERGTPGRRYHAVAEEGVPLREIAAALGKGMHLPVVSLPSDKLEEHFGAMQHFATLDLSASSVQTRAELDWEPTGPTLLEDLAEMKFPEF